VITMSDLNESHVALAFITDALFCSELKTGATPTGRELAAAMRKALRTHRGWNGCTRTVAAAFTTTPIYALEREAWSRQLAENALTASDVLAELSRME